MFAQVQELHSWLQPYYQQFITTLLQGRLTSSIIISGHEGLGGNELALAMAQFYLCHHPSEHGACGTCSSCQMFKRLTHQDVGVAYATNADEFDKNLDFIDDMMGLMVRKPSATRRALCVDIMRTVTNFLNESAVSGGRGKVVIIHGAQLMGEGAANAILKTFEEPSPNSLIIMTTTSLEALLPTILSRASKIVLREVPVDEAVAYLLNHDNQKPWVPHFSFDFEGKEADYDSRLAAALEDCKGLKEPIGVERAQIALSLNSYAPLAAMQMLLAGDDLQVANVVNSIAQYVQSQVQWRSAQKKPLRTEFGREVITSMRKLAKPLQERLLSELLLETLKYKANVPVDELPLINYGRATCLESLQVDHIFAAMDKLRFIADRSPLIPSRASQALLRTWLQRLSAP